MLDTLTNPIFWQGFAAGALPGLVVAVVLLTLLGRAGQDIPLRHDRRHGDGRARLGADTAPRIGAKGQISRRSQLRGGAR